VHVNDVAGAIPTIADGFRRLNDPGALRQEITLHQIGSPHVQHTARIDSGHRLQLVLHGWHDLPDAADAARHRHVHSDHRGALGDAIPLEDPDAELLDPQPTYILGELLGTRHDVAQAAEV